MGKKKQLGGKYLQKRIKKLTYIEKVEIKALGAGDKKLTSDFFFLNNKELKTLRNNHSEKHLHDIKKKEKIEQEKAAMNTKIKDTKEEEYEYNNNIFNKKRMIIVDNFRTLERQKDFINSKNFNKKQKSTELAVNIVEKNLFKMKKMQFNAYLKLNKI